MKDAVKGVICCLVLIGIIAGCMTYKRQTIDLPDEQVTFQGTIHHIEHTSAYNTTRYNYYSDTLHYSDIEVSYGDKYSFIRCLCAVDAEEGDVVDCGFTIKHWGTYEYPTDGYIVVDGVRYDGKWYNDETTRGEKPVY